ncbi:MAG: hypothetical protein ACTS6O_13810, partial [Giesbergeria sp.]
MNAVFIRRFYGIEIHVLSSFLETIHALSFDFLLISGAFMNHLATHQGTATVPSGLRSTLA